MSETCQKSVSGDGWHFRKCGRPLAPGSDLCARHLAGLKRREKTIDDARARARKAINDAKAAEEREAAIKEFVAAWDTYQSGNVENVLTGDLALVLEQEQRWKDILAARERLRKAGL